MCDIIEQVDPRVMNMYIPRSIVPSLALVADEFGSAGGARVPAGGRDLRTLEAILGALTSRYAVSVQIFTVLIATAGEV
jgi:hypothetical protein